MRVMHEPLLQDSALFLDIDGTLLEFAARPDLVVVPEGLPALLLRLREERDGALAILTGRPIENVDEFFPGAFAAAAEHGAVVRDEAGTLHEMAVRPPAFNHWLTTLETQTRGMTGVVIEEKNVGVVVHFRQAPEYGEAIRVLAETLIAASGPDVMLMKAHMAFELRPKGASKDAALAWFMARAPWQGRVPVFIGDDVTDEPAIALANELGGMGLHVGRDFGGSVKAVLAWLGYGR